MESGPLSALLSDDAVRKLISGYVTARIDIPEAYAIFGPYDTIRPALLVLDADGRRVVDIPLSDRTVDSLVSELQAALTKTPTERFVLTGKNLEPLVERLEAMSEENEAIDVVDGSEERIELWVPQGQFTPDALTKLVAETKSEGAVVDPVPVAVKGADAKTIATVPGVWFESSDGAKAWVCRSLLHPKLFADAGVQTDLTMKRLDFETLPEERQARQILLSPLEEPGVLHVISNVSEHAVEVVGTKDVDFEKVKGRIESIMKAVEEADEESN